MFEAFKKYILEKANVTEADLEKIEAVCQYKKLRKRQFLLQEGDVWKYNAFIVKGCLRTYTIDDKGTEHILNFAIENWWTGDRESLQTGNPSMYNIDTLEDAEVILITKANFDQLCSTIPAFNDMVNAILQRSFVASQSRIHTFLSLGAEEKYLKFLEKYPQLATRVPQGMIASYLGITAETLSRVRKQTAKNQRSS
ncbi:cAMP-binding domain of CRP or a regulatory subunit of cAMP-dependent protein kinases [Filimonas lacunae]|uniref:cAMP-binding domain of CRP or a regulatory subunit of cAMP-dependent protein kinases n=1 Tax=Filimonas lacunae TaxID=477680 RepID=A0A173MH42_9BACT|nr:Crp/Fnr family transcriptional regulator [Filimonas lacunae]BAV06915.1 Crp/Fnr family transcriptional regulator [Filimonas lacunae]SIS97904.1 cAMP-binding domain of CRP or a regulatory subunit of cAMP-dependent protein kinases [Filimonas lacunae]